MYFNLHIFLYLINRNVRCYNNIFRLVINKIDIMKREIMEDKKINMSYK